MDDPERPRARSLTDLAAHIDANDTWWRFPEEPPVAGFLGDGDVFFVGDQPSTSPWPRHDRGRRLFYDGLVAAGLGNAHLTDVIKTRGRASESVDGLPGDFARHISLFREELDLLGPSRVVAVGGQAERLLRAHIPEVATKLRYVEHFASAIRWNRTHDYAARLAEAAGRPSVGLRAEPPRSRVEVAATTVVGLVTRVTTAPTGARVLPWTLRRDDHGHRHDRVPWSGEPVVLDLSWRPSKGAPESPVGTFLLDVRGLLDADVVRYEHHGVLDRVRVRVVMRDDDTFALQVRSGSPTHLLPGASS